MEDVLIRKLERLSPFDEQDRALITSVTINPYTIEAHRDIIRQGDVPDNVHLIISGVACRFKILSNGARQIIAYLLPGDFCESSIEWTTASRSVGLA